MMSCYYFVQEDYATSEHSAALSTFRMPFLEFKIIIIDSTSAEE